MPSNPDVIILGAGAAGLSAAAHLAQAGRSVLLLEARDRIGGRIFTRQDAGIDAPLELGAEFIHGHAPANVEWLARAGSARIDAPDSHWRLENGSLQQRDSLFPQIQQVMQQNAALATHDMPLSQFLQGPLRDKLTSVQRDYICLMAEGFDAAEPSRISARAIVEEWTGEMMTDAPQGRPDGGYASLLRALSGALPVDRVRLQLQTVVREVRWSHGSVQVRAESQGREVIVQAPQAVVALPLGVLQASREGGADALRFDPPLDSKQSALRGLASGPVIKLLLKFRRAFWEELDDGRYRDATFFHLGHEHLFPTFWTQAPVRVPLLCAWAGGPRAARLSAEFDQAGMVGQALQDLSAVFSGRVDVAAELDLALVHDWQRDAFARGAYSYIVAGGADARRQLAESLQDTLFFAGEATDEEEAATVTGALRSGERVAREITAARISMMHRRRLEQ